MGLPTGKCRQVFYKLNSSPAKNGSSTGHAWFCFIYDIMNYMIYCIYLVSTFIQKTATYLFNANTKKTKRSVNKQSTAVCHKINFDKTSLGTSSKWLWHYSVVNLNRPCNWLSSDRVHFSFPLSCVWAHEQRYLVLWNKLKSDYYVLGTVNSAAPSAKIFAIVEITLG